MRFIAYWGEGYAQEKLQIIGIQELKILYEHDFESIKIGEAQDLSDLSGTHYLLRIE